MVRGEGFCWVGKKKTYYERHGSSDFYASEVKGLFKNRWLFRDWPVLMWVTLELAAFRKLSLPLGVSCERLERRLSSESAVGWVNVHLTITCSRKAFAPALTAAITHVLTLLQGSHFHTEWGRQHATVPQAMTSRVLQDSQGKGLGVIKARRWEPGVRASEAEWWDCEKVFYFLEERVKGLSAKLACLSKTG